MYRCVRCHKGNTRVAESRPEMDGYGVKRRRMCQNPDCGFEFITHESTFDVAAKRTHDRLRNRRWRETNREQHLENQSRRRMRVIARQEAKIRGIDPEVLYRDWNIQTTQELSRIAREAIST